MVSVIVPQPKRRLMTSQASQNVKQINRSHSISPESPPTVQKIQPILSIMAQEMLHLSMIRDVAAAPQTPQLGGGPRPTLGAKVSLKLLFGYVTIFSSADLFTTDLNCRKKLACDIISECNVILSRRI